MLKLNKIFFIELFILILSKLILEYEYINFVFKYYEYAGFKYNFNLFAYFLS